MTNVCVPLVENTTEKKTLTYIVRPFTDDDRVGMFGGLSVCQ